MKKKTDPDQKDPYVLLMCVYIFLLNYYHYRHLITEILNTLLTISAYPRDPNTPWIAFPQAC